MMCVCVPDVYEGVRKARVHFASGVAQFGFQRSKTTKGKTLQPPSRRSPKWLRNLYVSYTCIDICRAPRYEVQPNAALPAAVARLARAVAEERDAERALNLAALQDIGILGMTATGAALHMQLIREWEPQVIIVEEAGFIIVERLAHLRRWGWRRQVLERST